MAEGREPLEREGKGKEGRVVVKKRYKTKFISSDFQRGTALDVLRTLAFPDLSFPQRGLES